MSGIILIFILALVYPFLFRIGQIALIGVGGIIVLDVFVLFAKKKPISISRHVDPISNLGDENKIRYTISNHFPFPISIRFFEEFPIQMQERKFLTRFGMKANSEVKQEHNFTPKERGEFVFNNSNLFVRSILGFVERRVVIHHQTSTAVYPSILQMKQFELIVFNKSNQDRGIKKIRTLGHNNEFEQIKNYVHGDDFRRINWKATSRRNELMINQYQDERSQSIYCLIDKGRAMKMPFEGLTLLDYAINSTLAFSNIAIKKGDKVGVISFSNKIAASLPAEKSRHHLKKISENLYNQKTHFLETDYELLFYTLRNQVKTRSLLLLFTNFESEYSLRRNLPILKRINQKHLLTVIFFENTEIEEVFMEKAFNVNDIYLNTLAEKHIMDKRKLLIELRNNGIQCILSKPEELTLNSINKYLEFKSKGMI
ncbi:MAG: DUF58 domain-containing protein [Crocinitomicaceae bacterium]|nr:DUF58 domain-containing protein [Crocinitomicaceae bacterium]